jgi:hypothetical protein
VQRGVKDGGVIRSAEVRSPDIAAKERIAGEHHPGFCGARTIGDENRDALGCMSGSRADIEHDVSERDGISVVEQAVLVANLRAAMQIDRRLGARGEFAFAGSMIGMDVRCDNRLDAQSVAVRKL